MKYYFAYGSNLNVEQMKRRCPDARPVGRAEIPGYALVFRRSYLTIEPRKGEKVPVGIWSISETDEKALDRYEGFPKFYRKETINAYAGSHVKHSGLVYVMNDGFPIESPSMIYLQIVVDGYRDFGFGEPERVWLMTAVQEALDYEREQQKKHTTDYTTKP